MIDKVIQLGRRAALAAGAVLRQNYHTPHHITLKSAIDPVTESDLQSQEIIIALIRQAFPDHGFLAEESGVGQGGEGQELSPPPRSLPQSPEGSAGGAVGRPVASGPWPSPQPQPCRWIIDPLDGTVNYAHGFPMFCVSIAFEAKGCLEYGVVYDPLRDELFEARAGGGAWLNSRPIGVSTTDRLERALLATGFPYDIRKRLPQTMARLGRVIARSQGVRRAGSAALDMCYVACGRFDGFWEENLKPWDTAAGVLIVAEAKGQVSTFDGAPFELTSPNIAASNGSLHGAILEALAIQN